MALGSIKLVCHIDGDGSNLIDSLDLINFASGFEMADNGWIPQICTGSELVLTETLSFYAKAISQNDLALHLQKLDEWIARVNYYKSLVMRNAVWLRVQFDDETNARQALIVDLNYKVSNSPYGANWQYNKFVELTMVITRSAYWEELTPQTDSLGALNYYPDILSALTGGDVPARLQSVSFNSVVSGNPKQNTAYIGFKNDRYFDPSLFIPVKPLDAFPSGADTDTVRHAAPRIGAPPGIPSAMVDFEYICNFGTSSALVQRFILPLNRVSFYNFDWTSRTDYTLGVDQLSGRYLCLLRAMVVGSLVVRTRIRIGYYSAPTADKVYPRITVPATGYYQLLDMGIIDIPQQRVNVLPAAVDMAIKIDAEKVSGTVSAGQGLYLDGFILIPADGLIKAYTDDGFIFAAGDNKRIVNIETNPVGEIYGFTKSTGSIYDTVVISPYDWILPQSLTYPSAFVSAVSRDATGSMIDPQNTISISYIRRWRTLRGNE